MSKNNISKMGEILLKRQEPQSTLEVFRRQTPITSFEKLVFMDEEKEKEWNQLPDSEKSFVMEHLKEVTSRMESKVSIELLCHVINELLERVKKLEEKNT